MTMPTRHYDIQYIKTQRNRDVPVVDGYLFVAKDKERLRYRCKIRSCKATILLHSDMTGTYYDGTPLLNHPPHEVPIKEMNLKNSMKTLATSAEKMVVTTRAIASKAIENNKTARRFSSDLQFIRRARQGNRTPRVPTELSSTTKAQHSYSTGHPTTISSFLETSPWSQMQRTHLIFQSTARLANVPTHISSY